MRYLKTYKGLVNEGFDIRVINRGRNNFEKVLNESTSQEETIELIEDLFIMDIADEWALSNNTTDSCDENCWEVTKDHILYSKPPKNPITKLFIRIRKNKLRGKKLKLWDDNLEKFFSRVERLGYKVEKPRFWLIDTGGQFYYHIDILRAEGVKGSPKAV